MNKPMSQWIFGNVRKRGGSDESQPKRGELGSRVAGQEQVPLGQVPKSREGRAADMVRLNRYIAEALEIAKARRLVPANTPLPRELTPEDVRVILATFHLHPDSRCTRMRPDDLSTLLPPPHLAHVKRRSVTSADRHRSALESASDSGMAPMEVDSSEGMIGGDGGSQSKTGGGRRKKSAGQWAHSDSLLTRSTAPKCMEIARNQEDRQIILRVYDLLTMFPDRWLDSVVIDAYIHLLMEHCAMKDVLYVNSAEHDPSLLEIKNTPSCYKYIICPLFYRSHWTVLFISHPSKRIRYLNSQVVDRNTPKFQTDPFRELFPGYDVSTIAKSAQCDNSSCGVYCALWTYLFIFYDESEMDRIKCADAEKFRITMLMQLIISYIFLNKSLYQ